MPSTATIPITPNASTIATIPSITPVPTTETIPTTATDRKSKVFM